MSELRAFALPDVGEGLTEAEMHPLEGCVPAPCQGILGLQCRVDDAATFSALVSGAFTAEAYASARRRASLETVLLSPLAA